MKCPKCVSTELSRPENGFCPTLTLVSTTILLLLLVQQQWDDHGYQLCRWIGVGVAWSNKGEKRLIRFE